METESSTEDPISLTNTEGHIEKIKLPIRELKNVEGQFSSSPVPAEYSGKNSIEVETENKVEMVETVIRDDIETPEGESFFNSPSIVQVANDGIPSHHHNDHITEAVEETKNVKNEVKDEVKESSEKDGTFNVIETCVHKEAVKVEEVPSTIDETSGQNKEVPEKEKLEASLNANDENETTASTARVETIASITEVGPLKKIEESFEEKLKKDEPIGVADINEKKPEEKNLPPLELREKTDTTEDKIHDQNANDLHFFHPLSREFVQEEGERVNLGKQDHEEQFSVQDAVIEDEEKRVEDDVSTSTRSANLEESLLKDAEREKLEASLNTVEVYEATASRKNAETIYKEEEPIQNHEESFKELLPLELSEKTDNEEVEIPNPNANELQEKHIEGESTTIISTSVDLEESFIQKEAEKESLDVSLNAVKENEAFSSSEHSEIIAYVEDEGPVQTLGESFEGKLMRDERADPTDITENKLEEMVKETSSISAWSTGLEESISQKEQETEVLETSLSTVKENEATTSSERAETIAYVKEEGAIQNLVDSFEGDLEKHETTKTVANEDKLEEKELSEKIETDKNEIQDQNDDLHVVHSLIKEVGDANKQEEEEQVPQASEVWKDESKYIKEEVVTSVSTRSILLDESLYKKEVEKENLEASLSNVKEDEAPTSSEHAETIAYVNEEEPIQKPEEGFKGQVAEEETIDTTDISKHKNGEKDILPLELSDKIETGNVENQDPDAYTLHAANTLFRDIVYEEGEKGVVGKEEQREQEEKHITEEVVTSVSTRSVDFEESFSKKEVEKENFEASLSAFEENEATASSEHAETIAYVKEEGTIIDASNINKNTPEEKNLPSLESTEKVETETETETKIDEVEIQEENDDDLTGVHSLVKEVVQEEGGKGEKHIEDEVVTSVSTRVTDYEERFSQGETEKGIEASSSDFQENEANTSNKDIETIAFAEEEEPIQSLEESFEGKVKKDETGDTADIKEDNPEEKDLPALELSEKTETAKFAIQDQNAYNLQAVHPLLGEAVQEEGGKKDIFEHEQEEQVPQANEVSKNEETHIEEVVASLSAGSTNLEHTSTEGAPTIVLTSNTREIAIEKLEKVYGLPSERNFEVKEEAPGSNSITTKSDDSEERKGDEDALIQENNEHAKTIAYVKEEGPIQNLVESFKGKLEKHETTETVANKDRLEEKELSEKIETEEIEIQNQNDDLYVIHSLVKEVVQEEEREDANKPEEEEQAPKASEVRNSESKYIEEEVLTNVSTRSIDFEESFSQKEAQKENLEAPVSAFKENEATTSSVHAETIAYFKEEGTIIDISDINKNTPEEKNYPSQELTEKIETETNLTGVPSLVKEVEIQDQNNNNLTGVPSLVKEVVQGEGEKEEKHIEEEVVTSVRARSIDLEESFSQKETENESTISSEEIKTIAYVEGVGTIQNLEESIKETTETIDINKNEAEEKNLQPLELSEKTETNEVEIQNQNELVRELVLEEHDEQIPQANEVCDSEEKHIEEEVVTSVSTRGTDLEESFAQNESEKEKLEASLSAVKKNEATTLSEHIETIANVNEAGPIQNIEESFEGKVAIGETIDATDINEGKPEEKDLPTLELNEEAETAKFEIQAQNAYNLHPIHPLLAQAVQEEGEKEDIFEQKREEQVPQANEVSKDEETHVEEVIASLNTGSTDLEHTSTEGAPTVVLTSERNFEVKEEASGDASDGKKGDEDAPIQETNEHAETIAYITEEGAVQNLVESFDGKLEKHETTETVGNENKLEEKELSEKIETVEIEIQDQNDDLHVVHSLVKEVGDANKQEEEEVPQASEVCNNESAHIEEEVVTTVSTRSIDFEESYSRKEAEKETLEASLSAVKDDDANTSSESAETIAHVNEEEPNQKHEESFEGKVAEEETIDTIDINEHKHGEKDIRSLELSDKIGTSKVEYQDQNANTSQVSNTLFTDVVQEDGEKGVVSKEEEKEQEETHITEEVVTSVSTRSIDLEESFSKEGVEKVNLEASFSAFKENEATTTSEHAETIVYIKEEGTIMDTSNINKNESEEENNPSVELTEKGETETGTKIDEVEIQEKNDNNLTGVQSLVKEVVQEEGEKGEKHDEEEVITSVSTKSVDLEESFSQRETENESTTSREQIKTFAYVEGDGTIQESIKDTTETIDTNKNREEEKNLQTLELSEKTASNEVETQDQNALVRELVLEANEVCNDEEKHIEETVVTNVSMGGTDLEESFSQRETEKASEASSSVFPENEVNTSRGDVETIALSKEEDPIQDLEESFEGKVKNHETGDTADTEKDESEEKGFEEPEIQSIGEDGKEHKVDEEIVTDLSAESFGDQTAEGFQDTGKETEKFEGEYIKDQNTEEVVGSERAKASESIVHESSTIDRDIVFDATILKHEEIVEEESEGFTLKEASLEENRDEEGSSLEVPEDNNYNTEQPEAEKTKDEGYSEQDLPKNEPREKLELDLGTKIEEIEAAASSENAGKKEEVFTEDFGTTLEVEKKETQNIDINTTKATLTVEEVGVTSVSTRSTNLEESFSKKELEKENLETSLSAFKENEATTSSEHEETTAYVKEEGTSQNLEEYFKEKVIDNIIDPSNVNENMPEEKNFPPLELTEKVEMQDQNDNDLTGVHSLLKEIVQEEGEKGEKHIEEVVTSVCTRSIDLEESFSQKETEKESTTSSEEIKTIETIGINKNTAGEKNLQPVELSEKTESNEVEIQDQNDLLRELVLGGKWDTSKEEQGEQISEANEVCDNVEKHIEEEVVTGVSTRGVDLEGSFAQKEPENEKLEASLSAVKENETTTSSGHIETIANVNKEGAIKKLEESIEGKVMKDETIDATDINEEKPEEKDLPTLELSEKTETAKFEIQEHKAYNLHTVHPLVGEAVQEEGENEDIFEHEQEEQVPQANEVSKNEETHMEEVIASLSTGRTNLEHTYTEEAQTIVSERNFEVKEEASGDDSEERKGAEDAPIQESNDNSLAKETVDDTFQVRSPEAAPPELYGEATSYIKDNLERNEEEFKEPEIASTREDGKEQKVDEEIVTDLLAESLGDQTAEGFQGTGKEAEKFKGEYIKDQNTGEVVESERAKASKSIVHESSTNDGNRDIVVDATILEHEKIVERESEGFTLKEASVEENRDEEESSLAVPENDITEQPEGENPKGEEYSEQNLPKNELREKLELDLGTEIEENVETDAGKKEVSIKDFGTTLEDTRATRAAITVEEDIKSITEESEVRQSMDSTGLESNLGAGETEVGTFEKGHALDSTVKLEDMGVAEVEGEELTQEETSATILTSVATKCDDTEKSAIKDDTSVEYDKKHESTRELVPEVVGGDPIPKTDIEIQKSQIIHEEVFEGHEVVGIEDDIKKQVTDEEITVLDYSPEPLKEETVESSQEGEAENLKTEVSEILQRAEGTKDIGIVKKDDAADRNFDLPVEEQTTEESQEEKKDEKECDKEDIKPIAEASEVRKSTESTSLESNSGTGETEVETFDYGHELESKEKLEDRDEGEVGSDEITQEETSDTILTSVATKENDTEKSAIKDDISVEYDKKHESTRELVPELISETDIEIQKSQIIHEEVSEGCEVVGIEDDIKKQVTFEEQTARDYSSEPLKEETVESSQYGEAENLKTEVPETLQRADGTEDMEIVEKNDAVDHNFGLSVEEQTFSETPEEKKDETECENEAFKTPREVREAIEQSTREVDIATEPSTDTIEKEATREITMKDQVYKVSEMDEESKKRENETVEDGVFTEVTSSIKEITSEEGQEEGERDVVVVNEQTIDSNSESTERTLEAPFSAEETKLDSLNDVTPEKSFDSSSNTETLEEKTVPKENDVKLVEISSTLSEVFEKEGTQEDTETTTIGKDFQSAFVTIATEAESSKEAEPEGEKVVRFVDHNSLERSQTTLETSETSSAGVDIKVESDEISNSEKTTEEVDILEQSECKFPGTRDTARKSEDQTEIATGKEPSDENIQQTSILESKEKELVTTETGEITSDTSDTTSTIQTAEVVSVKIKDESFDPVDVSQLGMVNIEGSGVRKDGDEVLNKSSELHTKNDISELENAEILTSETDLNIEPGESGETRTSEFEKAVDELEEGETHERQASDTSNQESRPNEVPGILKQDGTEDIGTTQEDSTTKDDFEASVREQAIEDSPEEKMVDKEHEKKVFETTREVLNTTEETIKETSTVKDVSFKEETRQSSQDEECEKTETGGATEKAEKEIIEVSVVTGLNTTIRDVTTEGSKKEGEIAEEILDRQVKDSDSEFTEQSFEGPCSTVEIVPENILNQANLTADLSSLNLIDASEGETLSKESNEKLVESSSVVYEVSEKDIKEEISESADTVTSDFYLTSPAVITEVAGLKEVEPEANIISKGASSLDENADEGILMTTKHEVDDTLETKGKDQIEVNIGKISIDDKSEENLKQSSTLASKEDEAEVSNIIDKDPLEEAADIEKETEVQKVENGEKDKHIVGNIENVISELEEVDIVKREKELDTPNESIDSANVVIEKEVAELEVEIHTRERKAPYTVNYGTSPEKNHESVDHEILEPVHQDQSNETSETQIQDENKYVQNLDTVSVDERVIEQRFQEGGKEVEEKMKPILEVEDHENKIENSNETIVKSVSTEEVSEINKVPDPKLEAEEHGNKIQDANETSNRAVLSEEVELSELVSSEHPTATQSNENTEVSPITTVEENVLLQEGDERSVSVSAIEVGVSEEKILDEIDKGHVRLDDVTVDEKPVEKLGSVKLEETSDLVAQSINTEREITVKEVVIEEKKHTDELEEENAAAETSESRHQEALPTDNTEEQLQEQVFVVAESTTTCEKIENGRKEIEAQENDVEDSKVIEMAELAFLEKEEPREIQFTELGLTENIQGERSNEAPNEERTTGDEASISDQKEKVSETRHVDDLESEATKLATQIESDSHEKTFDLQVVPEGAVEKCDEGLEIELDNSGKAIESMSKFQSREVLKSEESIEEEHQGEATTKLIVEEKQLVEETTERNVAQNLFLSSDGGENIQQGSQEDDQHVDEYPGESARDTIITTKDVIQSEEISGEVNRGDEDEKEKITEDKNSYTKFHTVSTKDKKVENSTLVATDNAEATSSKESTIEREGFHESEQKIEGDILDEADKKYDKFDEKHQDENPIEAIGIGSEDRGPETFELTDAKLHGEQVQPVRLEENSDLVSQLPLIESENDHKEFVVVERSHVDEVEELKKSEIPDTNLEDSLGAKAIEETRELEVSELKTGENTHKESLNEEPVDQGVNVVGTSISEHQDHGTCVENPLEKETLTEQRPILGNSEQTPKDENIPIIPSVEDTSSQVECNEGSNLEFEKTEKDLESVSIFHSHEELIKPEDNETLKKETSNEQVPQEKEVEKLSHLLSHTEERMKEIQQDELHVEEYLGDKTRETSLVPNDSIQSEELSEKLVKDKERSTEGVEEPRQVSVDYETVKERFIEETKEVKNDDEKAIKSELEDEGDETNCGNAATEATTLVGEVPVEVTIANEDEQTQYQREKPGVLPHIHDSGLEATQREDLVVRELSHGITEEHFTENMISSANKSVPSLVLKDPAETTIQKAEAEVQEVGTSRIESEVEGIDFRGKTRKGDAEEGGTEEATSPTHSSLSALLQRSTKNNLQMGGQLTEEKEPTGNKEETQIEVEETGPHDHQYGHDHDGHDHDHDGHDHDHDDHDEEGKTDEEGDEHKKADLGSDAPVLVEATKDMDVKVAHKKSHGILSGVGSKVKHSLAKVKKAITGKSSHSKAQAQHESPKALPES